MSYWVYLIGEDGKRVIVPNHSSGGIQLLSVCGTTVMGNSKAELSVTYNYSKIYRKYFKDSLYSLNGKTGKEVTDDLTCAVALLGKDRDSDYWKATEGNAGYALSILLGWAKLYPNATFTVN